MIPKLTRHRDRKLLDSYHHMDCVVSNEECFGTICAHHLDTGGMGTKGPDAPENLAAVCHGHHMEIHKSLFRFIEKYGLHDEMYERGWWLDSMRDPPRWVSPNWAEVIEKTGRFKDV